MLIFRRSDTLVLADIRRMWNAVFKVSFWQGRDTLDGAGRREPAQKLTFSTWERTKLSVHLNILFLHNVTYRTVDNYHQMEDLKKVIFRCEATLQPTTSLTSHHATTRQQTRQTLSRELNKINYFRTPSCSLTMSTTKLSWLPKQSVTQECKIRNWRSSN